MASITINTGGFYKWFGNKPNLSKITIGTADDRFHYTILINEYERVVNIHKTIESADGKKYEQIFEMSFFTFYRFAVLFNKIEISLIQKYWLSHKINIGKLGRHDLLLFPFVEDEDTTKNFVDNKRAKKLRFKKEIPLEAIINNSVFADELLDSKEKFFWVVSIKRGKCRNQGFIFRFSNNPNSRSFFFVTKKNFAKYQRESALALFNVLQQLNFKYKDEILAYMFEQLNNKNRAA